MKNQEINQLTKIGVSGKTEAADGLAGDSNLMIAIIGVAAIGIIFLFSLFSFSSTMTNFTARPRYFQEQTTLGTTSEKTASPSAAPSLILEP